MLQMKEQGKNLQDQINEDEIGNLPEKTIHSNDSKDDPESQKEWRHRMRKYKKCLTKI